MLASFKGKVLRCWAYYLGAGLVSFRASFAVPIAGTNNTVEFLETLAVWYSILVKPGDVIAFNAEVTQEVRKGYDGKPFVFTSILGTKITRLEAPDYTERLAEARSVWALRGEAAIAHDYQVEREQQEAAWAAAERAEREAEAFKLRDKRRRTERAAGCKGVSWGGR